MSLTRWPAAPGDPPGLPAAAAGGRWRAEIRR